MSQRKRGRSLSAEGIAAFKAEQSKRGWNNHLLADNAKLSVSTIKRLSKGKPADLYSINAALSVLDLSVDPYLEKIQRVHPTTTVALETFSVTSVEIAEAPSNTPLIFYMIATYSNTKLLQIKCVLEALKAQLLESDVVLEVKENRLTVSGAFTPETRSDVEATIRHLEHLFDSCQLSGDITCATSRQPLSASTSVN